jgi:hypothetical protein
MHEPKPVGAVIQDRYEVLAVLGQGGSGITYRASDRVTHTQVALKELSLRGLNDWKKLELFERESQILESLDHPGIPQYADAFQIDTADDRYFYLVQDLAEGPSLAELVAAGERFPEAEVQCIAVEILQILQYLQGLNPPIIHRDIKPQNIIRRQDGRIFLVDFGAVQTVYRETVAFGSTVVGTYGYMAPEQFRGQAQPATDLYGLGATLLHLLTHRNPGDLPEKRLRIDVRKCVTVSDRFADWLEGLLEPVLDDRFPSAQAALAALTTPQAHSSRSRHHSEQTPNLSGRIYGAPSGSRVKIVRDHQRLAVTIPPLTLLRTITILGRRVGDFLSWAFGKGNWGALLLGCIVVSIMPVALGFGLVVFVIWCCHALLTQTLLVIEGDRFTLSHRALGFIEKHHEDRLQAIEGVIFDPEGHYVNLKRPQVAKKSSYNPIMLMSSTQEYTFGKLLTIAEKEWIVSQIQAFLLEQHL